MPLGRPSTTPKARRLGSPSPVQSRGELAANPLPKFINFRCGLAAGMHLGGDCSGGRIVVKGAALAELHGTELQVQALDVLGSLADDLRGPRRNRVEKHERGFTSVLN